MRWLGLVGFLGACGRYGFNPPQVDAVVDDGPGDTVDAPGDAARDAPPPCPPSYTILGDDGFRYRVVATSATWDAAEAACEAPGTGTHLAAFRELEDASAVAPGAGTGRHWIGVSDRITEGTFVLVIGGTAAYLPWQAGAPAAGGPDCVSWDPVAGTYLDETCTTVRPYVCACDRHAADHAAF